MSTRNRYAAALGRLGARIRLAKLTAHERRGIAANARAARSGRLPDELCPLFPAPSFAELRLPRDKALVVLTILREGEPAHLAWLARRYGRASVYDFLLRDDGHGLPFDRLVRWVPRELARRWSERLRQRPHVDLPR